MSKVNRETAVIDFEKWLDFKRISGKKREDNAASQEIIVDAICAGDVIVEDDCTLLFKLPEPVKDNDGKDLLKELRFMPRIRVEKLNAHLKGVKSDDADGRIAAYVAAITNTSKGMVGKLWSEDYTICTSIVVYFL